MSGFFTIAQTGLSANPIVACFGFLLLSGTLVVGVAALVVALLRWWKPDSIPAKLSLAAGAISCAAAIAFFGDDLARPESSPIWILLLGLPALAGGLLALWVSRSAGRVWFYAFAAMLAVVVIADGGRMSLRAWRIHRAFDAAEAGQTETVMRCIASGVDIESSDEYHRTILAAAVDGGHLDTVRALLNAGANPNDCCWGMLARAVIGGDEKMVRELVERGAQPTILFWGDQSLLVAARHKSSPAIVKLLEYAEHVSSPRFAKPDRPQGESSSSSNHFSAIGCTDRGANTSPAFLKVRAHSRSSAPSPRRKTSGTCRCTSGMNPGQKGGRT